MGHRNLFGAQWCETAQAMPKISPSDLSDMSGHAAHIHATALAGVVMGNLFKAGAQLHAPFGATKAACAGPREHSGQMPASYATVKMAYTRP